MPIIAWKECYATGIDEFDKEHQGLVEKINLLYEAIRNKDADSKLAEIISDLIAYTEAHFTHEEEILTTHNFPGLAEHQQKHTELRARVDEFKRQLANGEENLPLTLLNFLREWLLDHIVKVDKEYGEFLVDKDLN